MSEINWSEQHCGVHQAPISEVAVLMPQVHSMILETFPDSVLNFTWDVKVHMLMPGQYPCIPNWHCDFVPRINGVQKFFLCQPELPMYLWVSGGPLTQFKHGFVEAKKWIRFTQLDEHRGLPASEFCWRGFIRATHIKIQPPKKSDWLRRHSQVYLNANSYQW